MIPRSFPVATVLVAITLAAGLAAAEQEKAKKKFKARCPVTGKRAKAEHVAAYLDKKIYFCCPKCPKAFAADPKKFAAAAHLQLLATGQMVQVACPVTGRDLDPDMIVDVNGVKVVVCCAGCLGKVEGSGPEKAIEMCFAKIDKGFTLQTHCPVSGKPITRFEVVTHKGRKVYFCCPKCPAVFQKDPAKFVAKLPQFKTAKKDEKK